ncbi:hypothetical protein tb265_39930 [Gemmatimonadetes bacterium T265]|nr:hypothetical protein tb265_39930 [Gemmatimonadetes bacterium T265]
MAIDMPPDLPPDDPMAAGPDVPLDAALRAAARRYHEPPPAPADAMWAAIQARRTRAAPPSAGDADDETAEVVGEPAVRVVHLPSAPGGRDRARPPRARWRAGWRVGSLAAAAVLFVALGIEIGRSTASAGRDAPRVVAASARSDARAASPSASAPSPERVASAGRTPVAPASHAPSPRVTPESRVRPEDAAPERGAPDAAAGATSAPLRAATEQHLARAELLLATFAAHESGAAAPDSAWARDLLTTTRLLLDSPAGRDPTRRALLEDLELVLAQLARLPRADTPEERALIDRAIRRGDLLAKLRTAAPAGAPAGAPGA